MSGSLGASNIIDGGNGAIINANATNMSGRYYIAIDYAEGITFNNLIFKPMIVRGITTPTEYEPYHEHITGNIYLDRPLYKVNNIVDILDFEKNKHTSKFIVLIFNGTENFNLQPTRDSSEYTYFEKVLNDRLTNYGLNIVPSICTHFISGKSAYTIVNEPRCSIQSSNGVCMIRIPKTIATTPQELKDWFLEQYNAGTPVTLIYESNTITEKTIELPKLLTCKGTNIIELDTSIQPSNMEVSYRSKCKI